MAQAANITPIKTPALVIERGHPLQGRTKSPLLQAFRDLALAGIGDSFFIPTAICSQGGQITERAVRAGGPGWVSIRKCEGGFRAWKIAEPKPR